MQRKYLDQAISKYKQENYYAFHMPGHKGYPLSLPNPYSIDITEIENFDNLHEADGIIKNSQERAAQLYNAQESFFLINGSTCGILSAISACVPRSGTLLMGRNSHRAVYHAVYLRQIKSRYIMPQATDFNIQGSIDPDDISLALKQHPDINAVFITSPTYDGIVSDIRKIADIVHSYKLPLIVDEAHGAHFKFTSWFPAQALSRGADIVIHSLHKTLPAFTQTALLHVNSDYIDRDKLKSYLSIFQSSSPSYLLMAGIDRCIRFLENEGTKMFHYFTNRLQELYEMCKALKHIYVYNPVPAEHKYCFDKDISKLLISVNGNLMSGEELYYTFLNEYQLQMEMFSGHYVTALLSVMDRKEGFERLKNALWQIDKQCDNIRSQNSKTLPSYFNLYPALHQEISISDALESPAHSILITEASGQISQEYIYLYPPGIPLIVPGEIISEELLQCLEHLRSYRLPFHGLQDPNCLRINIVN